MKYNEKALPDKRRAGPTGRLVNLTRSGAAQFAPDGLQTGMRFN
jgi:hypothetical protein